MSGVRAAIRRAWPTWCPAAALPHLSPSGARAPEPLPGVGPERPPSWPVKSNGKWHTLLRCYLAHSGVCQPVWSHFRVPYPALPSSEPSRMARFAPSPAKGDIRCAASPRRVAPGTRDQWWPTGRMLMAVQHGAASMSSVVSSGAYPSNSATVEAVQGVRTGRGDAGAALGERMVRKVKTKAGRKAYARRKAIVEPVFGQISTPVRASTCGCAGFRR